MQSMPLQPYLLFDAGGTLIFPDVETMSCIAADAGIQVTPEQLFEIHCQLIYRIDDIARRTGHLADPFPGGYPQALFSGFVRDQKVLDEIVETLETRNRTKNLWTSTHPWVDKTLSILAEMGYKMSVISNADGRAEQILQDVNLHHYFEKIFDSTIVGASKPDKRLFEIALSSLDLQPAQALYVGDVYSYDVWGANNAGLGCVHLDPLALYKAWPGVHLPSLAYLPDWLTTFANNPEIYNIHPAKDTPLTFEPQTT
jgi:HAD superfamily hydrolase (TIGR01549 family)